MKQPKSDLLQGTLDLLVLRTLASGDTHGWGIAQRLQQISQAVCRPLRRAWLPVSGPAVSPM